MMASESQGVEGCYHFTQNVTMHGISHVSDKEHSKWYRVLWLLLVLVGVGYCLATTITFLTAYVNIPLKTKILESRADDLEFPTITVCNRNLWKLSSIQEIARIFGLNDDTILKMFRDLYDPLSELPPPAERYNWSDPKYALLLSQDPEATEDFFNVTAPSLSETILSCSVYQIQYKCADLFTVVKTAQGLCFEFNSDGTFRTSIAGKDGGISLYLDTRVADYTFGPTSYSEGFSIAFRDVDASAVETQTSIGIAPGTESNIMLQKYEWRRYPPFADYGESDCFDAESSPSPLHYYANYTYAACEMECETSFVIRECGCRDPLQPAINGTQSCVIQEMLLCARHAQRRFHRSANGINVCKCKDPCIQIEYKSQVSSYSFPSANYIYMHGGVSDTAQENMRANNLIVNIFFGKISHQILQEERAYTFGDLIANLGGTLGLCLGASVLTGCEYADFILTSIARQIPGLKMKRSRGRNSIKVEQASTTPASNEIFRQ